MANIHGVGDLDRGGNQPRRPMMGGVPQGGQGGQGGMQIPLFSSRQVADPRSQGFCSTLHSILCPYFSLVSFTFMISIINAAFYIATLIHSLGRYGRLDESGDIFLGADTRTLIDFGAKVLDVTELA